MTQIADYDKFHIINEGLNYWPIHVACTFCLQLVLSIFAFSLFNVRIYIYSFSYEEILFTNVLRDFK